MNISVSEASKRWGISRTTIYKKIDDGKLSRNSDKKIDTAEMLRVFGNPSNTERTEQNQKKRSENASEQCVCTGKRSAKTSIRDRKIKKRPPAAVVGSSQTLG